MNSLAISKSMHAIVEGVGSVYLRFEPELPDFTVHAPGILKVASARGEVEIAFDRDNIAWIAALLDVAVFTEGMVILAWNFKNLVTYTRHHARRSREYLGRIIDLKLIEGFMSRRHPAPSGYADAMSRAIEMSKDQAWRRVYDTINLPLASTVVPALECEGIVDVANRRIAYAHYEIDRSSSGRMICQTLARGYSPHKIGDSPDYKPRGDDEMFVYLDYRSMEVCMIRWLSGDVALGDIIDSGSDVYAGAWTRIAGDAEQPTAWKSTFLALFYGMGAEEMGRRHGWSTVIAREVILRAHLAFPAAFDYVLDAQDRARHAPVRDYFGRPRDLIAEPYKARNHVIQSPASVVCMEKLILLHSNVPEPARLAFSVHDGYALFCDVRALREVVGALVPLLESESSLCPGLRIRVSAKAGPRLNKMIPVPEGWSR